MSKLLSGRWLFTMVVAIVYAVLALEHKLSGEFIQQVTVLVLYAYFSKERLPQNGEEQK